MIFDDIKMLQFMNFSHDNDFMEFPPPKKKSPYILKIYTKVYID